MLNIRLLGEYLIDKILVRHSPSKQWRDYMVKDMKARKKKATEDFRAWLISEDIEFRECANGQFNIYNDTQQVAYTVWATTGRMIDARAQETVSYDLARSKAILIHTL